jgi:uncharacterized OB-fold protein
MFSPARVWREFPQRYRLEAAKCESCGAILYPPRLVCPSCGGRSFTDVVLPRDGKVVTYTVIRVPPAGFTEQTPLPIALVELVNGVRLMVQIADVEDPETLEIGMPVRLEFRRVAWDGEAGVIFYGHKAVRASA